MNVTLDGALILDREMLHDILSAGLNLPAWYGRNLDALYDCLTDFKTETVIVLRNRAALEENLGAYGRSLVRLLGDVFQENARVRLEVEGEASEEPS